MILTKFQGRLAGLVVDEVFGQRHFHTDDLEADDSWADTELKGLVGHNFPTNEHDWGVLRIDELQRRLDFMDGAREQ